MRAEPAQQPRKRDSIHLPLDHECKPGGQNRSENNAVQIAGVIGDHDALTGRQSVQSLDNEAHAGECEEQAGQCSRDRTAAL